MRSDTQESALLMKMEDNKINSKMRITKILAFSILLLLALVIGVSLCFCKADIPVSELKEKYTNSDSRFKKVNGMEIHYRVSGTGDPLVLLHGSGSSLHTWDKWVNILAKDFKVITLDLPAFGLTGPHPDGDYSMEAYSVVLDRFLQKLDIDSFYLAGNSFGGYIAWTYALNHPHKVRKLALLNSSGYPRKQTKGSPLIYKLANNPLASRLLMKCTPRSLVEKSIKETFVNQELVTEKMVDRYFDLALRTGNRKAFVDRVRQTKVDHTAGLKTLDLPVLLIWGDKDIVVTPDNAQKFKTDIADSDLIMYENVGHLPMEEIPSQSAADLKAFLWMGDASKMQLTAKESEIRSGNLEGGSSQKHNAQR